jgi:hypothetical protein
MRPHYRLRSRWTRLQQDSLNHELAHFLFIKVARMVADLVIAAYVRRAIEQRLSAIHTPHLRETAWSAYAAFTA